MSTQQLQGSARALALEIAAEARAEWGFATDIVARAFRAHRELSSGARRLVSETVYGLIRMDRRLDAIVDELVPQAGKREAPLAPLASPAPPEQRKQRGTNRHQQLATIGTSHSYASRNLRGSKRGSPQEVTSDRCRTCRRETAAPTFRLCFALVSPTMNARIHHEAS